MVDALNYICDLKYTVRFEICVAIFRHKEGNEGNARDVIPNRRKNKKQKPQLYYYTSTYEKTMLQYVSTV